MEPGTVIDTLRQRLLDRRRAIIGRVARTEDELVTVDGSQRSEVEEEAQELNQARLTAQLSRRGRDEIDAIDVAITRMERGEYGFCETCEEPIEMARLEVLPTARLCTTCAEDQERRAHLRVQLEPNEAVEE